MKVAVLGQGSIGRRHAALLCELGHDVSAYDVREDAPRVAGVTRAPSESAALDGATAAVIASPPSEHLRHARLALGSGVHVLVEKPLTPSADGVAALGQLARARGLVLGVAMSLRFHPGVAHVRRLVAAGAVGRPLRASVWCGSWLPGWRPGVDYRKTYSAQRELGGGVLLDAIHELDYAIWVLGPVRRVRGVLAHVSALELDVEDVAALVLEHTAGAITNLTLDYLDRAYDRGCRIVGAEGTISWSWSEQAVRVHRAHREPELIVAPSDVQPAYRAQLEHFLGAVEHGGAPATSAGEAAFALTVADAARQAARTGAAVEIPLAGETDAEVAAPAELALRLATLDDAEQFLRWRNDPAVRAASFSEREIPLAEHCAWFESKLADPGTRMLVAVADGTAVGQLRLDRVGGGAVEVHIALAPSGRAHGYAAPLLVLAAHEHARALGAERVLARVKPGNEASLRAFRRAGFQPQAGVTDETNVTNALWFELQPQTPCGRL